MSESTPPSRFPPFLLTPALSDRATAALAVAVRRRDATQAELRAVIEGCVRLLRDRGMTAGAMLGTPAPAVADPKLQHAETGETTMFSRRTAILFLAVLVVSLRPHQQFLTLDQQSNS